MFQTISPEELNINNTKLKFTQRAILGTQHGY